MSLSIGIVGLPNVGKSTLFNTLTKNNILVANYPFATIEPNSGMVAVPDDRLSSLAKVYNSNRIIPATVKFVDIAGLVAGASKGEGLGNQFLSHIRSTQALIHVVRSFKDPNVLTVTEKYDPKHDIEIINTELVLADLQTLENRLIKLQKEAKANPHLKSNVDNLLKAQELLNKNELLNKYQDQFSDESWEWLQTELQLITMKPIIYVFNIDEEDYSNINLHDELSSLVTPTKSLFIAAKLESELNSLDDTDRQELLESYGQHEPGLNQLIRVAYEILGLQSFLTAGEKEVRAWTIARGSTAPQAAGVIHTDFERGFIAAEIVDYQDLIDAGSLIKARANGKVRTEGKDYIVQPNDVIEFRFNV